MTIPLPDPADLPTAEKRALRIIHNNPRLMRTRNGYRQISANVTLKVVERLEARGLVRQVVAHARKTVMLTGTGMAVIGIMDERRRQKELLQ